MAHAEVAPREPSRVGTQGWVVLFTEILVGFRVQQEA